MLKPCTALLTRWVRRVAGLWLWLLVPAALAQGVVALPRLNAPLLLLGEVHDNAAQHALRLQALQAVVDRGARPALLLEMFDRDRQAAIDAVQQAAAADGTATATATTASDPGALDRSVDALIDAAGRAAGWHWPFYRPYLRLALQHGLPIMAANVSRTDARRVIQLGLAATGFQPEVPADIAQAQAQVIEDSHCGAIDRAMAMRLANAQVARDQFMASLIAANTDRGVVLLAGNGHVRRDIGVPRWLPAQLRVRSHAVGYLEIGPPSNGAETAAYDESVFSPPQARADPCASMRPAPAKPAPAAASR